MLVWFTGHQPTFGFSGTNLDTEEEPHLHFCRSNLIGRPERMRVTKTRLRGWHARTRRQALLTSPIRFP